MVSSISKYKFGVLVILFLFIGCGDFKTSITQSTINKNTQTDNKASPSLPAAQKLEEGIIVHKVRTNKDDEASDVWIYLPEKTSQEKLPVILVTAAGSYLWNGTSLDEGDQPEHLPYVKKGYAVIAYETPGSLDKINVNKATDEQFFKAAKDFKNSKAGLLSLQNALTYALEKIPLLDTERVFIAGHSSAATHSLLAAANEPRVKAAIAYAPATDLEKRLAEMLAPFDQGIPGFKSFIKDSSPKNNIPKIKIPIFIFHATDDSVVPIEDTKMFVSELQKSNANVTFLIADNGDHYDSMIQQGIPKAIEWLNKLTFGNKMK